MTFELNVTSCGVLYSPVNPEQRDYVCYARANSLSAELVNWMAVNPRTQNMKSSVALAILDTLRNRPQDFHYLNKGLIIPAESASLSEGKLQFELTDPSLHGIGDGGHTYRAIQMVKETGGLSDDCFVRVDVRTNLSPAEIINMVTTNNNVVQVDNRSLEDLQGSYDVLKELLAAEPFFDRLQFKMNQQSDDGKMINIDKLLAIILMFSCSWYDNSLDNDNVLPMHYSQTQSVQARFMRQDKEEREKMLWNIQPILHDIFELWDRIESELPIPSKKKPGRQSKKSFKYLPYTKYKDGQTVGKTLFYQKDIAYIIPEGIIYPILAAFRVLVGQTEVDGKYFWKMDPFELWNILQPEFAQQVIGFTQTPAKFGKARHIYQSCQLTLSHKCYELLLKNKQEAESMEKLET